LHRRGDDEARLRAECGQKLDSGPREDAHALCEKLYDPDDAERLTSLGTIYGQHGDPDDALNPFLRAAELSPQSPQVQYNLAFTYSQLNRYQDARAPLETALKRWPDLFPLNALYGAVLAKLGDDIHAYETLRHARQLKPDDAGTTDLLYETAMKLGKKNEEARQYSSALRYLEEATELRPQNPEPHRIMAEIYARTGKPAKSTEEQKKAVRLSGK